MKRALVPLAAAALILAGCATTRPAPQPSQPTAAEQADAALASVVPLVEKATIDSLKQAAASLAAAGPDQAGSAAGAPVLKADAAALFAWLYPEVDTPFADVAPGTGTPPGASRFLDRVLPALSLLASGAAVSQDRASAIRDDLAFAEAANTGSVLPLYVEAVLLEATQRADARARYEEVLRRDPGFSPAARRLIALIMDGGTVVQDLPRLEQLAGVLPTPAARFDALARAELAGGQPQKAADAAAQGLLAAPDQPEFVLLRAQALENLGDWYQSLWILDALLKVSPDVTDAIALKARLLNDDEQNGPEALRVLDDAETRFPNDPAFPELRGRILLQEGQADDAVTALKRSLALDPAREGALSLLLQHAVAAAQWNDAESWLERIPEASRGIAILRLGWQAEEGLGNHDKAIAYARAMGTRGDADEAQEREVRSLIAAGRAADALTMAEKGIAAAADPSVRSTLRTLRAAAGSADPLSDLRQALLDDPANGEALAAIADLFAAQGDLRKAAEYARSAASLDPQNAALAAKAAGFAARVDSGN